MSIKRFSTLKPEILERWYKSAEIEGIPKEAYRPNIKILKNERSGYSFGIIHNENRFKREHQNNPLENNKGCNLCRAVNLAQNNFDLNLLTNNNLSNFAFTLNKFPFIEGFSMGISINERPMYTTKNLDGLEREIEEFLNLTDETGFELFHNSPGFGATIPKHEHWHLTNFRGGYDFVGEKYGFDAAEKKPSKGSENIMIMPDFPFAHVIFQRQGVDKLVYFLRNIQEELGDRYDNLGVPHTISQGFDGILVCIGKKYLERSRGSGDVAGHLSVKTKEDFENFNYNMSIQEMDNLLFRKEDLNLERFI